MQTWEITLAAAIAEIAKPTVVALCETCEEPTSFGAQPGRGVVCSRCGTVRISVRAPLRRSA